MRAAMRRAGARGGSPQLVLPATVTSLLTLAALLAALACAAPASAAEAWWHIDIGARPSTLPPATEPAGKPAPGEGELVATAENIGDAQAIGPITLTDTLPAGLRATAIAGAQPARGGALGETTPVKCSLEHLSCEALGPVAPYDQLEVRIAVEVLPGASTGEASTVEVGGGSAPNATVSRPITVSANTPFGVEAYDLSTEAEGGGPVTQAGGHPFQVTGTIALSEGADSTPPPTITPNAPAAGPARDIVARLPPGLIANPAAVPRCLAWQFAKGAASDEQDECPYQSAVGVASVTFDQPGGSGTRTLPAPVFNIEPEAGEPARFGFFVPIEGVPVNLTTGVRSGAGEDWGVNLSSAQIPQGAGISSVRVTFWGVPGQAIHDEARGWGCLAEARGRGKLAWEGCVHFEESAPPAFVTLPTSCKSSLESSVEADSWSSPGVFGSFPASESLQTLTGCESLAFSPTISVAPTTHAASSPSGLSFDLNFDTEGLTSGTGTAQSDLERTEVSLPEGVTIDPSAGVGLGGCTQAQYASATLTSSAGVGCPEDSKLGTVEIETPLLFTTVYGSLYVAQPYENPFSEPGHPGGSLIALYVIARSRAERGIVVKLAGKVIPDPVTGRLTVVFEGDPPLPFENFNFHFREGAQAPLITPATCGTYTTQAQLTPYANPTSTLTDTASFQITSGSEGSPCPTGLPPFAPKIEAGTLSNKAGTFSPLFVDLSRTDAMQEISSFSTVLPLGLTADLTGVPFCPESDIEQARRNTGSQEEIAPSCPAGSLIGHSLVGTGVGAVLDYVPGKLYLAGAFHGDPLSVVSVTSAVIGPFDLGTVVIRFGLRIDPYTAQVSIDPTGSEPIPTIIDGIVTHVRDVRVSIDRSNFTLNQTDCAPLPIASALTSNLAQGATVSTQLRASGCGELSFKPKFTASTKGKTSRARGASLSVKLTMPMRLGTQANIRSVKVDLPKQLPSRLDTLQQACLDSVFNANPAACPKASVIGHARASTPILPVPLTGPAIFVSHGGSEFPSLVLVLQGYGFTIDLVGATFVNDRTGITSTTFRTVPDEPVGDFELTLPQGRYSALAAIANLCKSRRELKMPTAFTAQNGASIHTATRIAVTGCAGKHKKKKAKAGRRAKRKT